jgi:hypothetical protein
MMVAIRRDNSDAMRSSPFTPFSRSCFLPQVRAFGNRERAWLPRCPTAVVVAVRDLLAFSVAGAIRGVRKKASS